MAIQRINGTESLSGQTPDYGAENEPASVSSVFKTPLASPGTARPEQLHEDSQDPTPHDKEMVSRLVEEQHAGGSVDVADPRVAALGADVQADSVAVSGNEAAHADRPVGPFSVWHPKERDQNSSPVDEVNTDSTNDGHQLFDQDNLRPKVTKRVKRSLFTRAIDGLSRLSWQGSNDVTASHSAKGRHTPSNEAQVKALLPGETVAPLSPSAAENFGEPFEANDEAADPAISNQLATPDISHLPVATEVMPPVRPPETVTTRVRSAFSAIIAESGMIPDSEPVSLLMGKAEARAIEEDAALQTTKLKLRERIGDPTRAMDARTVRGAERVLSEFVQTTDHSTAIRIATDYVEQRIANLRQERLPELAAREAQQIVDAYTAHCEDQAMEFAPEAAAKMAVEYSNYLLTTTDWLPDELRPLTAQDIMPWPNLEGDGTVYLATNRAVDQFGLASPVVRHNERLTFDGSDAIKQNSVMDLRQQLEVVPDSTIARLLITAPSSGQAALVEIVPVAATVEIGRQRVGSRSSMSVVAVTTEGKGAILDGSAQKQLGALSMLHPDSKTRDPDVLTEVGVRIYDQQSPSDALRNHQIRIRGSLNAAPQRVAEATSASVTSSQYGGQLPSSQRALSAAEQVINPEDYPERF